MLVCPECGYSVDENGKICENCGCPIKYIIDAQVKEAEYSASSDINKLKKGVESGNSDAMYWLAYCYYYGENDVDEDEEQAQKLLLKAIQLGNNRAKNDFENWFHEEPIIQKRNLNFVLSELLNEFDSLILVDTETSGLDFQNNRVIELAVLKIIEQDGKLIVSDKMDDFIKLPLGQHLDSKIIELTGITDSILERQGHDSHTVFTKFINMFKNEKVLLIAYNAHFDLSFIYYSLVREGYENVLKQIKMLDALTIYKDRRQYPHKLENAISSYGLDGKVSNSHRAIDDTYALFEVLKSMDEECKDLDKYINLFGYNPKYGVSGSKISSVRYLPQPYNSYKKLYE